MSDQSSNLQHHFLIATPQMVDPNFSGTLTYLCEHDEHGAMGIIVNRPTELMLGEIFEQLNFPYEGDDHAIYAGGPVQLDRGFVLHTDERDWESSIHIADNVRLTSSKDILAAIAEGDGPKDYLVALGYAGWGAGQLEQELTDNCWLVCSASEEILFHTPDQGKQDKALSLLGIDATQLNGQIGHA